MQNLCFNILTFNYSKEKLTFYFSKVEDETLTRLHCNLVPNEVIEKFGEQEHYYTSFKKKVSGFYPVTKSVNPSYEKKKDKNGVEKSCMVPNSAFSISVIKRYYNALIHEYFKDKGFLVKPNFIRDTEIWIPSQKYDSTGKFNLYDRYSLRVQFKTITNHLELLLIYKGIPKVYKQSVEEMQEDVSP